MASGPFFYPTHHSFTEDSRKNSNVVFFLDEDIAKFSREHGFLGWGLVSAKEGTGIEEAASRSEMTTEISFAAVGLGRNNLMLLVLKKFGISRGHET